MKNKLKQDGKILLNMANFQSINLSIKMPRMTFELIMGNDPDML